MTVCLDCLLCGNNLTAFAALYPIGQSIHGTRSSITLNFFRNMMLCYKCIAALGTSLIGCAGRFCAGSMTVCLDCLLCGNNLTAFAALYPISQSIHGTRSSITLNFLRRMMLCYKHITALGTSLVSGAGCFCARSVSFLFDCLLCGNNLTAGAALFTIAHTLFSTCSSITLYSFGFMMLCYKCITAHGANLVGCTVGFITRSMTKCVTFNFTTLLAVLCLFTSGIHPRMVAGKNHCHYVAG